MTQWFIDNHLVPPHPLLIFIFGAVIWSGWGVLHEVRTYRARRRIARRLQDHGRFDARRPF